MADLPPELRPRRCKAAVYKRDTLRYSGRGPHGFTMHYNKEQCSRAARDGDLCRQHTGMEKAGHSIERLDWYR